MEFPPQLRKVICVGACTFTILIFSASFISAEPTSKSKKSNSSFEVSNFSKPTTVAQPNGLPEDWKLRVWRGEPDVQVVNNNGKNILRLRSKKASVSVYRNIKLDLKNFPNLSWQWKVTQLPKDADARVRNRDDQAAGIYVAFPRFPSMINSRFIAYIWETSVPEGAVLKNQKNPMVHYIVVRSGKRRLNEWITEERNVLRDYRRVFEQDPPMVGGVALLIDSDDTRSQAESFFAQIEFKKSSTAQSELPTNRFVKWLTDSIALPE